MPGITPVWVMPESLSALPSTQALDPFDHNGCQHGHQATSQCASLGCLGFYLPQTAVHGVQSFALYMLAGDNHVSLPSIRPSTLARSVCSSAIRRLADHCPHMPCSRARRRRPEARTKVLCRHGSILLMVTWGLLHHACQRNQPRQTIPVCRQSLAQRRQGGFPRHCRCQQSARRTPVTTCPAASSESASWHAPLSSSGRVPGSLSAWRAATHGDWQRFASNQPPAQRRPDGRWWCSMVISSKRARISRSRSSRKLPCTKNVHIGIAGKMVSQQFSLTLADYPRQHRLRHAGCVDA